MTRPIVIAIAGSNGAGKSTFFNTYLSDSGMRFVNADVIAGELDIPAYDSAEVAAAIRSSLVDQRESFIFETVLSDPVGDKVDALAGYAEFGYCGEVDVLILTHFSRLCCITGAQSTAK